MKPDMPDLIQSVPAQHGDGDSTETNIPVVNAELFVGVVCRFVVWRLKRTVKKVVDKNL